MSLLNSLLGGSTGDGDVPEARIDIFTISFDGQTAFTLSAIPVSAANFDLYFNGQRVTRGVEFTQSGISVTWLDAGGVTLKTTDTLVARYNDASTGASPVLSVFGRTGIVAAQTSDYDASQVDNDSSVVGPTVKDALDTIEPYKDASGINNDSGVSGSTIKDALDTLDAQSGVTSVFTRNGAVTATASDYDASQIDNDSTVAGTYVSNALDTLKGALPPTQKTVYISIEPNANLGNHRVRSISGTGANNFEFFVPNDFSSLVSLDLICSPAVGAAGPNKNIDLTSDYGTLTEIINIHTESDTTTLYDFTGLTNTFTTLDISTVFSNIAANDYCGINVDHNSIGGAINYYFIKITYNI